MTAPEKPIVSFSSQKKWEEWLTKNHALSDGVWLRLFKKDSGTPSPTYAEALDVALCYGWIDGQKKSYDAASWLQKFTPRRARSKWSKRNTEHVERLMKEKRMTSAGLKEIEAAKKDGRWKAAYSSQSLSSVPEDFLEALKKHKKAKAFFDTLNKANVYAITYRLQTAKKPETREKRLQMILQMMKEGKKFH